MSSDVAPFPTPDSAPESGDGGASAFQEMPHNFEAEQGLLGMLLIDNTHLERVNDFLRPDHFSHPSHQNIYATIEKNDRTGVGGQAHHLKRLF